MENGLNGHSQYHFHAAMPALSNNVASSSKSANNSEFLCHINHPEDVGAVVTSFCKVVEDSGQIKVEQVQDDDQHQSPAVKTPPQDIIVSIKDEHSRSSSDQESEEEQVKTEDISIQNEEEQKEEPKAKIEAVNPDAIKRSDSFEDEDDDEEEEIDDDEPEDIEEEDSEEIEDEDSEPAITKSTLRARPRNAHKEKAAQQQKLIRQISGIVRKTEAGDGAQLTKEENDLLKAHPKVFDEVSRRHKKRRTTELRKQEIEESPHSLAKKCDRMAKAIQRAKYLIVYTGAGISTAANIPDYRGPNGVWTCLDQGRDIAACDLARAEPTFTHMALFTLFKKGKLKHIVSQNCDGLHLRSGIPRYALSEVHGNMFIEVCKHCKPMRPYLRLFDVTERTSKNKHNTLRRCHVCGNSLIDTIVHFGERGSIKWPINWDGASRAAEKADVIICLGSSLKVLRRYPWLWCMDRPKKHRPKLYIVNLQWTPKDSAATCKLNGRCDDVMRRVMAHLEIEVPNYYAGNDPLLTYATPLHAQEEHTTTRQQLIGKVEQEAQDPEDNSSNSSSDVKSWSLDHSYLSNDNNGASNEAGHSSKKATKGRLVKSKRIEYQNIMWPRDALYISYKDPKFEYITDIEADGESQAYYCDCCDPARQKKRQYSSSEEEDEDEEAEAEDLDEELTSSSVDSKAEKTENNTPKQTANQPGWFGKGRRKRTRC